MNKWTIGVKSNKKLFFVASKKDCCYTSKLENAKLYNTREEARSERTFSTIGCEKVFKIKLNAKLDAVART